MKKTYITPNTEVILLNTQQPLLDMSLNNNEINTQLSRELLIDDDLQL